MKGFDWVSQRSCNRCRPACNASAKQRCFSVQQRRCQCRPGCRRWPQRPTADRRRRKKRLRGAIWFAAGQALCAAAAAHVLAQKPPNCGPRRSLCAFAAVPIRRQLCRSLCATMRPSPPKGPAARVRSARSSGTDCQLEAVNSIRSS